MISFYFLGFKFFLDWDIKIRDWDNRNWDKILGDWNKDWSNRSWGRFVNKQKYSGFKHKIKNIDM